MSRDLARERERVAPDLEEVATHGLPEPDHVRTVRQPGRRSDCGRSRVLHVQFNEVGEGIPVSRGRDDRVERLAATVGKGDLALGQALDGGQDLDAPSSA